MNLNVFHFTQSSHGVIYGGARRNTASQGKGIHATTFKLEKCCEINFYFFLMTMVSTKLYFSFSFLFQDEAEQRIRERLDLQETMHQQIAMKEQKKQAEREEEEEFRQQVS